jgi:UDP-N-acetylmuramate dehydrogenase
MQNVGAYGQEVSDTIQIVLAFDRERGNELVRFTPNECRFGYRTSVFRGSARWVVVAVTFLLPRSSESMPIRYSELARTLGVPEGGRAPLRAVREAVLELRRSKGMVVDPADPESKSAGSFFTNPIVDTEQADALEARLGALPRWPASDGKTKLSAAWLIENSGFTKGYTRGRVGISRKHALALVNRGGATAAELLELAAEIRERIRDRFAIDLTPEPVIVTS